MEDIEKLIEALRKAYNFQDWPIIASHATIVDRKTVHAAADALERLNKFEGIQMEKLLAENARLMAQLSESQRRERAAVEDISVVAYHERKMPCFVCTYKNAFGDELRKHCQNCNQFNSHFEWRGPGDGEGAGE